MDIASFFCELKQGSVKHILLVRIVNRRQFGSSPPGKKKGQRQTCFFQHFQKNDGPSFGPFIGISDLHLLSDRLGAHLVANS